MNFEWDQEKEKQNIAKHYISFKVALRVFADPYRIEYYDERHSDEEDRFRTIGEIGGTLVLVTVIYTERGEAIRMISARLATKNERRAYYAGQGGYGY